MALHWTAAALLVAVFGLGLLLEDWPRDLSRNTAMMVHFSLGTLVLALALARLLRRLLLPWPVEAGHDLADRAGRAMHWALYAVMIILPLVGMLARWASGRPLSIFGGLVVPAPFPIGGVEPLENLHALLAWTLTAMVAVHVLAALRHHFLRHDGVLRRMLPAAWG